MDQEWEQLMREEHGALSMRDLLLLGPECERCSRWDLDTRRCAKGRRPRLVPLLDGPNEECHLKRACPDFEPFTDTERAVSHKHYWSQGGPVG